jgi:hypothetical protein
MLDVRDHAGPCWTICGTLTRAIELRTIQPKKKKVGDFESARPHYRFFQMTISGPMFIILLICSELVKWICRLFLGHLAIDREDCGSEV